MAERRMFAKTIIDSDAFLDMPITARLLYYDLSMRADDDGFVNSPKKIMRMVGASNDDLGILIMRKFILPFDNGVVVIKHWRIHNYIRKDMYHETKYKEEKAQLSLDENNAYTFDVTDTLQVCNEVVTNPSTQVRLGKVRLGKDRLGKDRGSTEGENEFSPNTKTKSEVVYYPNDELLDNAFKDFVAMRKKIKKPMTERAIELAQKKLTELSNGNNDLAIEIINQSILNGWQSFYALKNDNNYKNTNTGIDWGNV